MTSDKPQPSEQIKQRKTPPKKVAQPVLPVRQSERGGPKGPEPTRYGDWENNGRCTDF